MRVDDAQVAVTQRLQCLLIPLCSIFVVCCCLMVLQHSTSAQQAKPMDQPRVNGVKSGHDKPIITPQIDEWDYKLLHLPNGLEVLLISDQKADMAAAAMDVCSQRF